MRAGWYISGAGHVGLIALVLFGGVFAPEEYEPVTVAEVSVITEAEFAALQPRATAPDIASDAPEVTPPAAEEEAPEAPAEDAAPEVSAPVAVQEPETPDTPDVETPEPLPNAVIVEDAPTALLPPTDIDGTAPEPDAVAAPAPRVAPVPQVAPPPVVETAPVVVEDTAPAPDAPPEEVVEDEPEPAAPDAASDRIVTEAEEVETYAPASSMRPRSRPARPVRVAEEPPEETPETPAEPERDATVEAIAAAVAEANEPTPSAPTGPPLTGGEKDAFRVAVGGCWVVDSGGRSAGVTVTVAFSLKQDGTVDGAVRLLSASGGEEAAQRTAFEKARRAILRCQKGGYKLPVDKYEQWREIEATFNPEGMQYR